MLRCLEVSSLLFRLPHCLHRAIDQAAHFEADISLPTAVLFFECPEDEMEKRLLKRGETSGRSDDNAGAQHGCPPLTALIHDSSTSKACKTSHNDGQC